MKTVKMYEVARQTMDGYGNRYWILMHEGKSGNLIRGKNPTKFPSKAEALAARRGVV